MGCNDECDRGGGGSDIGVGVVGVNVVVACRGNRRRDRLFEGVALDRKMPSLERGASDTRKMHSFKGGAPATTNQQSNYARATDNDNCGGGGGSTSTTFHIPIGWDGAVMNSKEEGACEEGDDCDDAIAATRRLMAPSITSSRPPRAMECDNAQFH